MLLVVSPFASRLDLVRAWDKWMRLLRSIFSSLFFSFREVDSIALAVEYFVFSIHYRPLSHAPIWEAVCCAYTIASQWWFWLLADCRLCSIQKGFRAVTCCPYFIHFTATSLRKILANDKLSVSVKSILLSARVLYPYGPLKRYQHIEAL
jgi:hypothetical protein